MLPSKSFTASMALPAPILYPGPALRPGTGGRFAPSGRFAFRFHPYRSSTSAVLLAYAVLLASKKSVFTMLALEYWLTQAMSSGSER